MICRWRDIGDSIGQACALSSRLCAHRRLPGGFPGRQAFAKVRCMGKDTQRRLAAIVAADIAGYSRLMEVDEEGTLAHLHVLRGDIIDPALAEHGGRINVRAPRTAPLVSVGTGVEMGVDRGWFIGSPPRGVVVSLSTKWRAGGRNAIDFASRSLELCSSYRCAATTPGGAGVEQPALDPAGGGGGCRVLRLAEIVGSAGRVGIAEGGYETALGQQSSTVGRRPMARP